VIHVDFLPHGVTVNAQYYNNLLCNDVHRVVQKKRPEKLSNYSTACHCLSTLMKATLAVVDWEIMDHPPYSPDVTPSDGLDL
jgi:hypothetical protein